MCFIQQSCSSKCALGFVQWVFFDFMEEFCPYVITVTACWRLCQDKGLREPQYHRNKKNFRACAQRIFALKVVLSSVPKSKGERSRGTDTLAVECV